MKKVVYGLGRPHRVADVDAEEPAACETVRGMEAEAAILVAGRCWWEVRGDGRDGRDWASEVAEVGAAGDLVGVAIEARGR